MLPVNVQSTRVLQVKSVRVCAVAAVAEAKTSCRLKDDRTDPTAIRRERLKPVRSRLTFRLKNSHSSTEDRFLDLDLDLDLACS